MKNARTSPISSTKVSTTFYFPPAATIRRHRRCAEKRVALPSLPSFAPSSLFDAPQAVRKLLGRSTSTAPGNPASKAARKAASKAARKKSNCHSNFFLCSRRAPASSAGVPEARDTLGGKGQKNRCAQAHALFVQGRHQVPTIGVRRGFSAPARLAENYLVQIS